MIIARTPYRISLFGGGTDFPAWYLKHGGSVVAATIDKYCYLNCRYMPPFFDYRHRIVWSKIENCVNKNQITHPAVRAMIDYLGIDRALEVHHIGDLPSRSGMGSSSSFTVGLLNALNALSGRMTTKHDLATQAIHIEQNILKEAVGSQDQVSAAYGGLNRIDFRTNAEISVVPITIPQQRISDLQNHLMLFYTGIVRTSSEVTQEFVENLDQKYKQLSLMQELVEQCMQILNSQKPIADLGELFRTSWEAKRELSKAVTNSEVDQIMNQALSAGASGGKLTGAGGGGFLLLFVLPERQEQVTAALSKFIRVPFAFEASGSQIIFANNEIDYSTAELGRLHQPIQHFRELNQVKGLK